jgi:hypothetical protein
MNLVTPSLRRHLADFLRCTVGDLETLQQSFESALPV